MSSRDNERNKKRITRLTTAGVLVALAFILSYLESLLPSFTGVPGVKPGFANIAVMCALYALGGRTAVAVALIRVVLSGFMFTGMNAMLYSLAGSALSLIIMLLLRSTDKFSVPAVSIAGAVAHNAGQILLACLMLGKAVLYYLPVLIISGSIAGLVIGIISAFIIPRIALLQK
ncbi:MAG: Gx transporter family protein [Lachnospiraceae bacterium]|nr:Gx transporter family protein [Lachnospiraceae bacterium]